MKSQELAGYLRLVVITDGPLAAPRSVLDVVRSALKGGARAVQLRNKGDAVRDRFELGLSLRQVTRDAGALLFVNDRLDLALALQADGIHVGPDDLPVAAVRAASPPGFFIGRSADDPEVARRAVEDGASYIGCGTVYATSTKPEAGDVIGTAGLRKVVKAVEVPVVAIGGITVQRSREVADAGVAGVAVVGAVMGAEDPEAVARALRTPFGSP
jgi:thiamine-phosphate pyrophosphorylase